jgi:FtsP/CotA-like multicopper oxidase with cupredoxin domain
MSNSINRRDFLKVMGASAGAFSAAAITGSALAQDHGHNSAETTTVSTSAAQEIPAWQEMDQHHEEGINIFLENIGKDSGFWNRPMEYTMDGDVKVFDIRVQEIRWETMPGTAFNAMAYNGVVPGPEIRVDEGDKVRFNITNEMTSESTAIHWHGLMVPIAVDGVPFITQRPITPGETQTFEFTLRNFGSHMYHSHYNAAEQVTKGLLGAFIVEPKDKSREPEYDADYTMILNDSMLGFTINGKGFPYTQPVVAKLGQKIRVRYMNEGLMIHPMHLHGMPQLVFAKDGFYLPVPFLCDTLNIAPGERYDVLIDCTEPGVWAYHCHILSHAEARHGMFGMVTVLIVEE